MNMYDRIRVALSGLGIETWYGVAPPTARRPHAAVYPISWTGTPGDDMTLLGRGRWQVTMHLPGNSNVLQSSALELLRQLPGVIVQQIVWQWQGEDATVVIVDLQVRDG